MWKVLRGALASLVVMALLCLGLVLFGGGSPPPTMASISDPFRGVDLSAAPTRAAMTARDGETLFHHHYPGGDDVVVLALHGSSAMGASLHPLATALNRAGATVYAPDIRGHGASAPGGDVDHIGQLEEDLSDTARFLAERHPEARLVLMGFSSGGGLALRHAGGPEGALFDELVLLAPMLGPFAPTFTAENPFAGDETWSRPYLPRLIGLSILNAVGVHSFDHLPVIGFAVQRDAGLTAEYSHRMLESMNPKDHAALLSAAPGPVTVIVGERDEVFHAPVFAPTIHAARPDAKVVVVQGVGHTALTLEVRAVERIVQAAGL